MAALGFRFDPLAVKPANDESAASVVVVDAAQSDLERDAEIGRLVRARTEALGLPAPQAVTHGRLKRVTFDADAELPAPSWLAKGLLPKTGLGMLYGESSAGKTFLAVYLALCTAYGLPFFGRRVKQAGVVYVASEAGASVLARLKHAERALRPIINATNLARRAEGLLPLKRAPIEVITEAPNLGPDGVPARLAAEVEQVAGEMASIDHRLGLVILDTLHASVGGADENSAADMGAVLRPLRQIVDEHDLHLLLVHHPGKDLERGARGSNSLFAAMDAVIEVRVPTAEGSKAKPADAIRRGTAIKVRDGDAGGGFAYRLSVVEIAQDEDGDPVTTCVVEPVTEAEPAGGGGPKLGGHALNLLAIVRGMAGPDGAVNLERAREAFTKGFRAAKPDAGASTERSAWKRAAEALAQAGIIGVEEGANKIQILTP